MNGWQRTPQKSLAIPKNTARVDYQPLPLKRTDYTGAPGRYQTSEFLDLSRLCWASACCAISVEARCVSKAARAKNGVSTN
jgi:hypothetical protein